MPPVLRDKQQHVNAVDRQIGRGERIKYDEQHMNPMFPYNTQAGSRVDAAAEHSIGKQNRDSESRSKSVEDDYIRLKGVGNWEGQTSLASPLTPFALYFIKAKLAMLQRLLPPTTLR